MKYLIPVTIFFVSLYFVPGAGNLEHVQDDELLNLIKTEKYVIVLFSRRYCDLCNEYENELTGVREEVVEALNAWVVKVVDSQMARLYSPKEEPAIVFFRYGIPLLYDGPLNDEHILHTFTTNKDPVVKELTDETFEHLTQAATGATTGDWLVMFYTPDCVDCQRLQAVWETVGAKLKSRMNVARVNRASTGAATARRFNVFHVPAFILFRHGKMYSYHIQKYDIPAFVSFAQEWYKNVKPEKVPSPKSMFDDFLALMYDYFQQIPVWYQGLLTIIFLCGFCLSFIYIMFPSVFQRRIEKPDKKKGKKQSKD